jgi:leader peptidase (prepilin peptidase) / N-methyltransferase
VADHLIPLFAAILGAIIGSFVATLVIRWPEGRSVMLGRSQCDACAVPIAARHMIPLVSQLMLRRKCAACGAAFDPRHGQIEVAAALIGGLALWIAPGWDGLAGAVFGWLLLALGALDVAHFWLPNALTASLAITGLASGLAGLSPPLPDRLIGAAAGFGALWLIAFLYKRLRGRDGLGGGDPKMLGGIGAWLGWQVLPHVVVIASLAGLTALLVKRARGGVVSAVDQLPFGAMLAVAAFPVWILFSKGVLP